MHTAGGSAGLEPRTQSVHTGRLERGPAFNPRPGSSAPRRRGLVACPSPGGGDEPSGPTFGRVTRQGARPRARKGLKGTSSLVEHLLLGLVMVKVPSRAQDYPGSRRWGINEKGEFIPGLGQEGPRRAQVNDPQRPSTQFTRRWRKYGPRPCRGWPPQRQWTRSFGARDAEIRPRRGRSARGATQETTPS